MKKSSFKMFIVLAIIVLLVALTTYKKKEIGSIVSKPNEIVIEFEYFNHEEKMAIYRNANQEIKFDIVLESGSIDIKISGENASYYKGEILKNESFIVGINKEGKVDMTFDFHKAKGKIVITYAD